MKTRIARGFTLVEIAVVVAVLSIIATMTLVTYNRVQAEGRDTKRKNDIVILSSQLEKYYEKNGLYPMGCGGTTCTTGSFWYFPDTTNVISTSSTSAQLTTLLSRDMTNIYDPSLGAGSAPIVGTFYTISSATKGYVYRGQHALRPSQPVGGTVNIINLTDQSGSKSCSFTVNLVANSPPPNDSMTYILAYFAESTQTWEVMFGDKGVRPYMNTNATPGFCNVAS